MNKTPPLLPEETLARVMRVARFDGLGVLIISGLFALAAGSNGDKAAVIVGIMTSGAGALELHGVNELRRGEARGLRWLVLSQMALLISVLAYCSFRITHVDLTEAQEVIATMQTYNPQFKPNLEQIGYTVEDFTRLFYFLNYALVSLIVPIYAFVLSFYYLRRRRAIETALGPETVA